MKKKVLSYVALSSALLTAAPLLGNVTANAATTNNNTTSSSAKVSSSSSSAKESSKVSATSSSKAADKKAARSAVRVNNFAEASSTSASANSNNNQNQDKVTPDYVKNLVDVNDFNKGNNGFNGWTANEESDLINAIEHNTTVVPNVYGQGFTMGEGGGMAKYPELDYNGHPFTGYDAQDNIFWYKGIPYTLAALEKAGIKVPQNIVNAMKEAAAKANNGNVRLANGQTIRTYGYNHYVANVNARTLPKTGESNSIVSLLKALF